MKSERGDGLSFSKASFAAEKLIKAVNIPLSSGDTEEAKARGYFMCQFEATTKHHFPLLGAKQRVQHRLRLCVHRRGSSLFNVPSLSSRPLFYIPFLPAPFCFTFAST
ncbi:unnamed protein product, partial [Phaeothamnion confervicola]